MANPAFIAVRPTTLASGANCAIAMPAALPGDLLIAVVNSVAGSTGTVALTAPSGWTQVQQVQTGNFGNSIGAWTHVYQTGDPASATWSVSKSSAWTALVFVYRGQDSTPIDASASNNGNGAFKTSWTTPSITPNVGDCTILAAYGAYNGSTGTTTWTPPSGWTERGDVPVQLTQYTGLSLAVDELAQTTAAAISATGTVSASATANTIILAIRPVQAKSLPMAGSFTQMSALVADLGRRRGLHGAVTQAETFSGAVTRRRRLTGQLTQPNALNGGLTRLRGLRTAIDQPQVFTGHPRGWKGLLSQLSGFGGRITRRRGLHGAIEQPQAASGTVSRRRGLAGTLPQVNALNGRLSRRRGFSGTISQGSQFSGNLTIYVPPPRSADGLTTALFNESRTVAGMQATVTLADGPRAATRATFSRVGTEVQVSDSRTRGTPG